MRNNCSAGTVMPKSIRTLNKSEPRWKPYPWSRFSADEFPRDKPISRCPDTKCVRAKACLAAHKGLFCQRTHFARTEGERRVAKSDMEKYIESLPSPPANAALEARMDHIKEVSDLRAMETREKVKLWRAGAFGKTYGSYRSGGLMKSPPPRHYVEE
jgi:hypothetical protein